MKLPCINYEPRANPAVGNCKIGMLGGRPSIGSCESASCRQPAPVDIEISATGVVAVPLGKWPLWAKAMAKKAIKPDRGIGDTVYRVIGECASAQFELWHLAIFGRRCRCGERRARWNALYPLQLLAVLIETMPENSATS